jgi:hypothetical protein
MERNQDMERRGPERRIERRRSGESPKFSIWYAVGGLALLGAATLVVVTLPDIKRYIKISTM